jgi:hypothetical protein
MATRSNIHFVLDGRTYANIYVHYDGYPSNRVSELMEFFQAVKKWTNDTRFNDPEYLAAKFVVWYSQSGLGEGSPSPSLDFLGIGVAIQDQGDIDYIYEVHCDTLNDEGVPEITYTEA